MAGISASNQVINFPISFASIFGINCGEYDSNSASAGALRSAKVKRNSTSITGFTLEYDSAASDTAGYIGAYYIAIGQ